MSGCFDFRIIKQEDGTEIFDRSLSTPYDSITPCQMMEYIEADNQIAFMESIKRREQAERKRHKRTLFHKAVALWSLI